jgi:hypothetical protein
MLVFPPGRVLTLDTFDAVVERARREYTPDTDVNRAVRARVTRANVVTDAPLTGIVAADYLRFTNAPNLLDRPWVVGGSEPCSTIDTLANAALASDVLSRTQQDARRTDQTTAEPTMAIEPPFDCAVTTEQLFERYARHLGTVITTDWERKHSSRSTAHGYEDRNKYVSTLVQSEVDARPEDWGGIITFASAMQVSAYYDASAVQSLSTAKDVVEHTAYSVLRQAVTQALHDRGETDNGR